MANDVETHAIKELTTSNVIDECQKEAILWDLELNASEEEKELGWLRLSQLFGVLAGISFACALYSTNVKMYTHFASWRISSKSGAVRMLHLRLCRFKSSRDTL